MTRAAIEGTGRWAEVGGAEMQEFAYQAMDAAGKMVAGAVWGRDRASAAASLRQQGLFPVWLVPVAGPGRGPGSSRLRAAGPVSASASVRAGGQGIGAGAGTGAGSGIGIAPDAALRKRRGPRLPLRDLARATGQLAGLLAAGVPLDRSLAVLVSAGQGSLHREALPQIQRWVESGSGLAEALERSEFRFPGTYTGAVRAGESAGALPAVLLRLAEFLSREDQLRRELRSSLIYPMITLSFAAAAVTVILTVVVPRFSGILADSGQQLPFPTQILVGLGWGFSHFGWVIMLALAAFLAILRWSGAGNVLACWWDRQRLTLPGIGLFVRLTLQSQFFRTLGLLLNSGVPLSTALDTAIRAVDSPSAQEAFAQAAVRVREGASLAGALRQTGLCDGAGLEMVRVGEETGALAAALQNVASQADQDVQMALKTVMAWLEPAIILLLAGVVAFVALSMLLPVLSLNMAGMPQP